MADDITDVYIATEAGDAGWQSLSALAAEQVDAKLPIESADGTVKLASLAQKSFSVQVGDKGNLSSQLIVDSTAVRIKQGSANSIVVTAVPEEPNSWLRFNGSDAAGFFGYEQAAEKFRILDSVATASAFEFETNTGNLYVTGQVQTDKITSKAGASPSGGVSGDATIGLGSHITFNANAAGTAEDLVAVFSSFTSTQRGLQVKNGINGNIQNAHVILDAKSDGGLGKMTFQTDGTDVFWIGKENGANPVDIKAFDAYTPTNPQSICTKKYVDDNAGAPAYDDTQIKADLASEASIRAAADTTLQANIDAKIWVGTTSEYLALDIRDILPTTLYCLTD